MPSPLDMMLALAKNNGYRVTSTTGGKHNPGSKHGKGLAIDIDHTGVDYDQLLASLPAGFRVLDERTRPAGQAVWGGPHFHIEYTGSGEPVAVPNQPSFQAPIEPITLPMSPSGIDYNGLPPSGINYVGNVPNASVGIPALPAPPVPNMPQSSLPESLAALNAVYGAGPQVPVAPPPQTNFAGDFINSAINAGSAGLMDLPHGNGVGSTLGSIAGPLVGTLAAGALAPETGFASLALPAAYLGTVGAGTTAREQFNRVGQIDNPLAVGVSGVGNALFGALGPVGKNLPLLRRMLANAVVGGGGNAALDVALQAAEQQTLNPKLDLGRLAQTTAVGTGLGAGVGAIGYKPKPAAKANPKLPDDVQAALRQNILAATERAQPNIKQDPMTFARQQLMDLDAQQQTIMQQLADMSRTRPPGVTMPPSMRPEVQTGLNQALAGQGTAPRLSALDMQMEAAMRGASADESTLRAETDVPNKAVDPTIDGPRTDGQGVGGVVQPGQTGRAATTTDAIPPGVRIQPDGYADRATVSPATPEVFTTKGAARRAVNNLGLPRKQVRIVEVGPKEVMVHRLDESAPTAPVPPQEAPRGLEPMQQPPEMSGVPGQQMASPAIQAPKTGRGSATKTLGDEGTYTDIQGFQAKEVGVFESMNPVQQRVLQSNMDAIQKGQFLDAGYDTKTGSTSDLGKKVYKPDFIEVSGNSIRVVGKNRYGEPMKAIIAEFDPKTSKTRPNETFFTSEPKPVDRQGFDVREGARPTKTADETLRTQQQAVQQLAEKFPDRREIQAAAKLLSKPNPEATDVQGAVKKVSSVMSEKEMKDFLTSINKRC